MGQQTEADTPWSSHYGEQEWGQGEALEIGEPFTAAPLHLQAPSQTPWCLYLGPSYLKHPLPIPEKKTPGTQILGAHNTPQHTTSEDTETPQGRGWPGSQSGDPVGRAGAGCTGLVPRASVSSFNKGVAMGALGCRAGFSTRRGPYCCQVWRPDSGSHLGHLGIQGSVSRPGSPRAASNAACSLSTQDLQTPRRGQVPLMGLKGLCV